MVIKRTPEWRVVLYTGAETLRRIQVGQLVSSSVLVVLQTILVHNVKADHQEIGEEATIVPGHGTKQP